MTVESDHALIQNVAKAGVELLTDDDILDLYAHDIYRRGAELLAVFRPKTASNWPRLWPRQQRKISQKRMVMPTSLLERCSNGTGQKGMSLASLAAHSFRLPCKQSSLSDLRI
ncbi:hypothetical protein [Parasphingorhabdus sp.]|uniref:hypothetical protein n=1 Tax=Parasphingorhabdus sp. TaxID=2709688 RepID=UPI003A9286C4